MNDGKNDELLSSGILELSDEVSGEVMAYEPSVPALSSAILKDDPYAGKTVSLDIEGRQEVFYRGAYVTRIILRGASLIVGRRDVMAGHYPDIDLAMYRKQDRSLSRRHLQIYRDISGHYFVEDLCNNHATFLNSYSRCLNLERVQLTPGDRIFVSISIAITFNVR